MPHITEFSAERRSGNERRRPDDESEAPSAAIAPAEDPIAAWPLVVPAPLRDVRCLDPWCQVVHRSLVDAFDGDHASAGRAWDDGVSWHVSGPDPTAGVLPAVGGRAVRGYHAKLEARTAGTFRQELILLEAGRGPIVEAHARTTARRGERLLDIPTLLVFELASLRIRRVTEIPGDVAAWETFWRD